MDNMGNAPRFLARLLLAGLTCLALTGCFFLPGQFQSSLDIRRDGQFTYRYTGEILFLFPERPEEAAWTDSMANCGASSTDAPAPARPCSKEEVAAQKAAYEASRKRDRDAGEDIAQLIGYNPVDAEGNKRLAAELMQYPGWNDVRYLGKGKFYVDYQMAGKLDREFAFPVIPQVQTAMPFVNIAPDRSGKILVTSAGLASQQFRKMLIGQMSRSDGGDPMTHETQALLNLSKGMFTVTTDAIILESNGLESGATEGRRVAWNIDGATSEMPKLRLALDR